MLSQLLNTVSLDPAAIAAIPIWDQYVLGLEYALDFLARHNLCERPCRFDVVTVDVSAGAPVVEVYANAFDAVE